MTTGNKIANAARKAGLTVKNIIEWTEEADGQVDFTNGAFIQFGYEGNGVYYIIQHQYDTPLYTLKEAVTQAKRWRPEGAIN